MSCGFLPCGDHCGLGVVYPQRSVFEELGLKVVAHSWQGKYSGRRWIVTLSPQLGKRVRGGRYLNA